MNSKSLIAAVPLQRHAEAKRDTDGDVIIAGIWLTLYLLMVVGALFVNRNGYLYAVPLLLFAAVLGGRGVLDWRRRQNVDHVTKTRKLFTYVSPKNIALIALPLLAVCAWSTPTFASALPPPNLTGDLLVQFWQTPTDPVSVGPGDTITAPSLSVSGSGLGSAAAGYATSLAPSILVRTDATTPDAAHQSSATSNITLQYFVAINGPRAGEAVPVNVTAQALVGGSSTGNVTTNFVSADIGFALNGPSGNLLFYSQGGGFTSNDEVNLISGDLYVVNMFADLESIVRGPGRVTAEAMIDPVFAIDPNFADAGLFSLAFSDGIANTAAEGATPLPATLPLFGSVLGGGGLLCWRRKKKATKSAFKSTADADTTHDCDMTIDNHRYGGIIGSVAWVGVGVMKSTTRIFAAAAFALTAAAGVNAASAVTISNTGLSFGTINSFGTPDSQIYGEVFTAPITGTLSSFTLFLSGNSAVTQLYGGVGDWNGSNPNSFLYTSGNVPGTGGGPFTFSPNISVTAGQQYVAFLSVFGISSAGQSDMPWGFVPSTPGLEGFFWYNFSNGSHGTPTTASWSTVGGDAEFSVTVDAVGASTPLPAALPLFASGAGALGLFGWRRKKKAAFAA